MNIKDIVQINWYGDECIGCACEDLQKDCYKVSGQKALLKYRGTANAWTITAGCAQDVEYADKMRGWGLAVPEGWERYLLHIEKDRIIIAGSDARGTMWGIYRLSGLLGIPAGICFTQLLEEPRHILEEGDFESEPFTYKFRGWFLNDEDLLTEWHYAYTRKLDYPFYQHITSLESLEYVVETALRMNINLIIPASFMDIDDPHQEVLVAYCVKRGLYVSQHHIEPLGVSHWYYQDYMKRLGRDTTFSFVTHKDNAIAAWTYYASKWAKYKENVIWQLGLRGRGDRPVWHDDTSAHGLEEWGNVISEAIQVQYDIVKDLCGTDFYSTSTLWMEGALMYEKGYLRFPKNTTLVFADVGPTQMMAPDFYEIQRESGRSYGLYYHICYYGDGPHLCQGTDLRKMAYNYDLAIQKGDTEYSILNVSNVRGFIPSIEANACITAWGQRFDVMAYYRRMCRVYYGNEQAYKIYLGYFDAFADLSAEEVEKRYSRHFSLKHGSYDFLYCPATDGIVRSTAKAALSGDTDPGWLRLFEESIRKFCEVLKEAEKLACNAYFNDMIWQIRYMIALESWCLCCCRYGLSKEQKELEEALKYLDEILAMQQEDEKGIWKNWYRGDKKIGIRKLMEDTRCLKEGII